MFATKASSGMSMVFPDVCKIPAPPPSAGGPGGTPIPYPTFAQTAVKSQKKAAANLKTTWTSTQGGRRGR